MATTQVGAFDADGDEWITLPGPAKRKATPAQLRVLLMMRERDRRWAEARIEGIKKGCAN